MSDPQAIYKANVGHTHEAAILAVWTAAWEEAKAVFNKAETVAEEVVKEVVVKAEEVIEPTPVIPVVDIIPKVEEVIPNAVEIKETGTLDASSGTLTVVLKESGDSPESWPGI